MSVSTTQLPEKLYKYEPFSINALTNLKKQSVYFGPPSSFNDPYDCAITPSIVAPKDSGIEKIRQNYLSAAELPGNVREQFAQMSRKHLREVLTNSARDVLNRSISDFTTTKGVTCFSETNRDLLMWSHYGGRYKGFCLEFSTSSELFSLAKKVRYVTTPPVIDIDKLLPDIQLDIVQELFCTKSLPWQYEQEWRCFHREAGTLFTYSADSLSGVYFGPDIDVESKEIVCLILQGQNEFVRFWNGARSTTNFRVEFQEFTYTSFLDAKAKGLR